MAVQAKDDFDLIGAPDNGEAGAPSAQSDSLYAKELESYGRFDEEDEECYERRVRHAFFVRELKQIDDIVASRKNYANNIYWLVVGWLAAMGVIVLLQGFKQQTRFDLDVKVLLALIGGTTLNVIGIFTIVTNFLFPKNGHSIFSRDITPAVKKPVRKATRRESKPATTPPSTEASADPA